MSKETRNNIVETLKNKCKPSRMTDYSTGVMLRAFHTSFPILCIIISLFAPRYIVNLVIVLLIIIFIMYIAFGGCILSMIENKICNDDFTIADPFLELLQLDKTSNNRYNITLVIGIIYYAITAIIYHVRFN
jgi:hypothetical protein